MKTKELFLSDNSIANNFVKNSEYPYEVLPYIKEYIIGLGNKLGSDYELKGNNIWVHKDAKVSDTAFINGPCIIDSNAEIRHCAYIRGSVIVGKNCVVGNSCEIKNAILFDNVQVPHFNYVGDSILGYHSHLGAGAIISNLKSDKSLVTIKYEDKELKTNLKKVGAFLGDYVEVGCNSVLNPGTIIGPYTSIYPLTSVRGVIKEKRLVKSKDEIVRKR